MLHEKYNPSSQQQVEQLSMMLDTVPIQMWFLSSMDTYGMANQHYADFLGKQKQKIEFKSLEDFRSPEVADVCRLSNKEVFESGQTICSEEWMPDPDGRPCLIKITKTPVFDQNGNMEYIVCFGIDVTHQRKIETKLFQSEENFRTFLETINDIVFVGNLDGSIIYSNPAALIKLGFNHEQLCQKRIIDLHPEYVRKEATAILTEMLNGKRTVYPLSQG